MFFPTKCINLQRHLSWNLFESLQTASFLFFMTKVLCSEILVSEMGMGYTSLSIFLAVQHPPQHPLHALRVSDSAVPQNRAPFPSADCHSQIPWTSFSRNHILQCQISLCNLFLCPFYINSNNLSSFLAFLSFWCLLAAAPSFPCHVAGLHAASSSLLAT